MAPIKIALVGLGKIARDEHIPALRANDAFALTAVASPHHKLEGLPNFGDLPALIAGAPDVTAVALCTPPQVRYDIARQALLAGLHVLLEKPPGVTVSEVVALSEIARQKGVTLFASWHSRHARAVEPARAWLKERRIHRVTVTWKEDVRVWHPGQTWIWKAGGLGVFDPGINALSILTRIIPGAWLLKEANLSFPQNCATPIAASLLLEAGGIPAQVDLDFLQTGPQTWSIDIETESGRLELSMGGKDLSIDGNVVSTAPSGEYPALYAHFAELVRGHRSDVDIAPLQLVADAFLCGRRTEVAAFVE
ncbi:MAG TPA: Gfo/Idh/MocA family oxidoreductase [Steroidobacteraceae bacterium]|jgi:D-galactose 1-dehydrogenase|nr:Gfo/Idh/MocA family oxidoreductase [Steroidobacteraceae bacterium]